MKKVILSSNIHHYNYTAIALLEMGWLSMYITEAQFPKRLSFHKFLPKKIKSILDDRVDQSLDENKTISLWGLEIIYKSILKSNFIDKKKIILKHNRIYDQLASNYISKCDFFHVVSSVGYKSAQKAKAFGAKIIVDERAEHPNFLEKILKKENQYLRNAQTQENNVYWKESTLKEYKLADYLIVPSSFVKRTFIEEGFDSKKIFIIPYGCNIKKFYPKPKCDDIFRVISVGKISPRKGTRYLIDAFNKLPYKNIELVLIGSVENGMEELVKNLPDNIKHYPYVPNSELNNFYTQSSVFVLPSLSDAFPLVVLEAMGAGLPVIVSENVGSADIIDDGINGFIVPIMDSVSIFNRLEYLYKNNEMQKKMAQNALTTIKNYTWEQYKTKLINTYQIIEKLSKQN